MIGASILAGIGVTIGFILLIIPGFVLLTYWWLIVPCIVLGRSGVFPSFGNSWRTVRGCAWRVFGTYVLVFLILIGFAIVLGFVLILLPLWLRNFLNNVISGTLVAPFLTLVSTLIYYRLTAVHAGMPYVPTGPSAGPAGTGYPAPGSRPWRVPRTASAAGPLWLRARRSAGYAGALPAARCAGALSAARPLRACYVGALTGPFLSRARVRRVLAPEDLGGNVEVEPELTQFTEALTLALCLRSPSWL